MDAVPVIDLFAGPGGLGEGFSSVVDHQGRNVFRLVFSVEKERAAHSTLRLRAVYRHLKATGELAPYFDYVRGSISAHDFLAQAAVQPAYEVADKECKNLELGSCNVAALDREISAALNGNPDWLLIGGPPCQAYSLVGRARRANDTKFEDDEKHFLYREYLRIIKVHRPAVFVMENVKGLLSSSHAGNPMFQRILKDLSSPARGLGYEIRSLVKHGSMEDLDPADFVIHSEKFGVPQTRHRVILLGVRSDWTHRIHELLSTSPAVAIERVIGGLPPIRSRLSRQPDSPEAWHAALSTAHEYVRGWGVGAERQIVAAMRMNARRARQVRNAGAPFQPGAIGVGSLPLQLRDWIIDPAVCGVLQHESRPHMAPDLARYMFAATFAQTMGYMPRLGQYPPGLLPEHASATAAEGREIAFRDRFRVQLAEEPATTIVSHIAKDGHYYIHYDPVQCRSLTVREAARIQTFPDNYFFEGGRTHQYVQIGNAVPPLLAYQIALSVAGMFKRPVKRDSTKADGSVQRKALSLVA